MQPVRLPASATLALPRWGLIALALLYILPGLIGRDPWKNEDASSFGIMWTMAHGGLNDWLWPHIVGLPIAEEGPLAFWLGALGIKLFSWLLGDPMAARIATIGFFLLGISSVWHSAHLLGRRADAQPLKLAFGGQPDPKDFSRTLADAAVLIYLGCLGLLINSHQSSAESLQVSLVALFLYSVARYVETANARNAAFIGLVLGALALTRGWVAPLTLWLGLLGGHRHLGLQTRKTLGHLAQALLLMILAIMSWTLLAKWAQPFDSTPFRAWMRWNYAQISWPDLASFKHFFRYGIWFFWPAWPYAGWAVYAWRRQHNSLHIVLPLAATAVLTLLALFNPVHDESKLLLLLPPLAILAAFGLPTMKRGAINAVDWFSVMAFSMSAGIFWLLWIAEQTGWPAQLSNNVLKLVPGFKPQFGLLPFLIALATTLGWLALVRWRIARRPSVLWRAVVLSSGGLILCWVMLMTLFLPWANYRLSYVGVAKQIAKALPPASINTCVDTNVSAAQRASLAFFDRIPFAGFASATCDLLLVQDNPEKRNDDKLFRAFPGQWHLLWEGRRPSDRDERFRLYRRVEGAN